MLTPAHAPSRGLTAKLFRGFSAPSRLSPVYVCPRYETPGHVRAHPHLPDPAGTVIRRAPGLFRAAALLAVLGMILGWMEVAMPDVHDGHGTAEPEAAWVQLSHGHPPAPAEAPGHAPQSPHTCHCIHAHAPALPAANEQSPPPSAGHLDFASTAAAFASFTPEPHFRPPVA